MNVLLPKVTTILDFELFRVDQAIYNLFYHMFNLKPYS